MYYRAYGYSIFIMKYYLSMKKIMLAASAAAKKILNHFHYDETLLIPIIMYTTLFL